MQKNENRTGYKKTKVGWIPEEWEALHLGNLTSRIGDGIHTTPTYVEKSDIYFINGNNLVDGQIKFSEQTKCVSENESLKHKRDLNQRTLLLSINGTIGSVAYYNGERVVLGKSVAYINCNQHLNKHYAFNVLSSNKTNAFFRGELTGSTIKNLSLASIRILPVPTSSLPEQEAIVGVLECWDRGIRNLELKIGNKRRTKKGLMQRLLSGQLRLPGFAGDWKTVKLGEVCDIRRGASPRPIKDPRWFSDKGRGWVRISDVTKTKKYLRKTTQSLSFDGEQKSVKVNIGELIMSICATIGVPRIVEIPVCIHDGFVLFQNLRSLEVNFFFHALTEKTGKLSGQGQPGTQKNLNIDIVSRILLQLPPLTEQQAIAEVLSAADGEIEVLERKLEKWRDQKKYLLNNLVTGTIRLPQFRTANEH